MCIYSLYIIFNIQYIQPICLTQCTLPKTRKKHMSRPPKTSSTFSRCVFHPPFLARRFGVFPILWIHLASERNRTHGLATDPEKKPKYLITRSQLTQRGRLVRSPSIPGWKKLPPFFLWTACVSCNGKCYTLDCQACFKLSSPEDAEILKLQWMVFFSPLFWMTFFGNQCFSCTWKYW